MTYHSPSCRISVCMATYNGARFVKEQLASILIQLTDNDEVIVSDDSSTDDTVSIIQNFGDKRVRLLKSHQFRSPVLNFENALNHASGEYIFLADQDDIWQQDKVGILLHELQSVDLVISDCIFIDELGCQIGDSYFAAYRSGSGVIKNFAKNTYLGNCMAFRRIVLNKVLPFPPQLYKASKLLLYHDTWIGIVANIWFQVRFIPKKLSFYRRHSTNASPTEMSAKSSNSLSQKITSRYWLATGLLSRVFRHN